MLHGRAHTVQISGIAPRSKKQLILPKFNSPSFFIKRPFHHQLLVTKPIRETFILKRPVASPQ